MRVQSDCRQPFTIPLITFINHKDIHCVRQAGAGGWSWSGVREKHCYLAGGWWLELEERERETL